MAKNVLSFVGLFALLLGSACGDNRFHTLNASAAACVVDLDKGADLAPGQPCRDGSQCQHFCCECAQNQGPSHQIGYCFEGRCADKTKTCGDALFEGLSCKAPEGQADGG